MDIGRRKLRQLVKSYLQDPELLQLATLLSERPASAAGLAEATGIAPARVRRLLRQMRADGMIESVEEHGRRGTVEHFHAVAGALYIDDDELGELSLDERRQMNGYILKLALTEATRSLVTQPLDRNLERLDGTLARLTMRTDEEGWRELAELHRECLDRLLVLHDRIAERLEKKEEEGFKATSVILLFESETAP